MYVLVVNLYVLLGNIVGRFLHSLFVILADSKNYFHQRFCSSVLFHFVNNNNDSPSCTRCVRSFVFALWKSNFLTFNSVAIKVVFKLYYSHYLCKMSCNFVFTQFKSWILCWRCYFFFIVGNDVEVYSVCT